jgi:hypothetical protein
MIELSDKCEGPKYNVLEPILELLLGSGNRIATDYRWGSNSTRYFCVLTDPIDFSLVEREFRIPASVQLLRKYNEIDYGLGTVVIRCA